MRTKFITTLAAATLLAVSSATAALAEAPDNQASAQGSGMVFTAGSNLSRNTPAGNGFVAGAGPSAHYHPHGVVHK